MQRINDGLGFDNTGEHTRDVAADDRDQNRIVEKKLRNSTLPNTATARRLLKVITVPGGDAVTDNAARSRRACQLQ